MNFAQALARIEELSKEMETSEDWIFKGRERNELLSSYADSIVQLGKVAEAADEAVSGNRSFIGRQKLKDALAALEEVKK